MRQKDFSARLVLVPEIDGGIPGEFSATVKEHHVFNIVDEFGIKNKGRKFATALFWMGQLTRMVVSRFIVRAVGISERLRVTK